MTKYSLVALAILGAQAAQADVLTIPNESGFSGFVMAGITAQEYQSNFFKGDKGEAKIDSVFQSPSHESSAQALIGADLRYTFADTRTQLFLGNLIQDAVRYDLAQQFGVRQQVGTYGILSAGYVFSAMPAKTWADPYQVGRNRSKTDYKTQGARFAWDDIGGSHVNLAYTWRTSKVDSERSGEQLISLGQLTRDEANLLDRNGDLHRVELSYDWRLQQDQTLTPAIIYKRADLDGKAESSDTTLLQLTYAKTGPQWSLVGNVFGGKRSYDEANPIYGKKANADEWGLNGTFFWHQLFGVDKLSGVLSAGWAESNSDINFYDTEMSTFSAGLMYSL